MKITIISGNNGIERALSENQGIHEFYFFTDLQMAMTQTADILVADAAFVTPSEILTMERDGFGRIAYLTQEDLKVELPDITVLKYDGRSISAGEQVRSLLVGITTLKNVLAFWSPVSGAGTTMVAMTAFRKLPETYRALYLSLTDMTGADYVPNGVTVYLSDILSRLCSSVLDIQELVRACENVGNKYYLGGLSSVIDAPRYSVDDIKRLLSMAAGYFDYVIVDAGFGATLMAIAATTTAARTYVITTQSAIAAARYEQLLRQCYCAIPEFYMNNLRLILNKEDHDVVMLGGRTANIQRQYGLNYVGSLRLMDQATALRAEVEGGLLYDLDTGTGYRTDMETLLSNIYSEAGVSGLDAKKKSNSLFARIFPVMRGGK